VFAGIKIGCIFVSTILSNHTMTTIIFKSEKKAKVYEIRSVKAQGVYSAGELMRRVKTDNINSVLNDTQYQVTATEIQTA
jgi:hypothetical protein